VTFASDAKLSEIEPDAFSKCFSLSSICIPSSVEILSDGSFPDCYSLSTVRFGADSKLRFAVGRAFSSCYSLSSIWIPASLRDVVSHYRRILKIIEADSKPQSGCSSLLL
jgi:hypothetical protein